MDVVYAFGFLSDAGMHQRLMGISAVTTSFANIFWGFAKDGYMLHVDATFVGFASGGYDICLFGICDELAHNDEEYYLTLYSLFGFIRGVATFTVGIIGVLLIRRSPEVKPDEYALGKYKSLFAYAASMSMASGLITLLNMYLYPETPRPLPESIRETSTNTSPPATT